jgi:hypothetical protein
VRGDDVCWVRGSCYTGELSQVIKTGQKWFAAALALIRR